MTDILLELVSKYGLVILAGTIFLAALGAPLPGTVLLVLSGAFAVSGEMDALPVVLTAYLSAIAGDIVGFTIGAKGGTWLRPKLKHSSLGPQVSRAERFLEKWGSIGVFLSRWLVAPIGPTVNYVSGIGQMSWQRFVLWDLVGETIWVAVYMTIGMAFSSSALSLVDAIASASWVLIGALGMVLMGRRLLRLAQKAGNART